VLDDIRRQRDPLCVMLAYIPEALLHVEWETATPRTRVYEPNTWS
jgi:hypothetical protein